MKELLLPSGQYEQLLEGAWLTVQLLGRSVLFGLVVALIAGVARLSRRRWVRGIALTYTEFARGISTIVMLFVFAFTIPILTGIDQGNKLLLASIALGLNMGGYGAEIVRGAIQAVPKGQTEATIALNFTESQRLRLVVLPQAMRLILPPMGNLTIEILKGTALVSLVGMSELANKADNLVTLSNRGLIEYRPAMVILFNTLLIYFVLAQVINGLFRLAERYFESRYRSRGVPVDKSVTIADPTLERVK